MVNLMAIICVTIVEALYNYSESVQLVMSADLYSLSPLPYQFAPPLWTFTKVKWQHYWVTRSRKSENAILDFRLYRTKFVNQLPELDASFRKHSVSSVIVINSEIYLQKHLVELFCTNNLNCVQHSRGLGGRVVQVVSHFYRSLQHFDFEFPPRCSCLQERCTRLSFVHFIKYVLIMQYVYFIIAQAKFAGEYIHCINVIEHERKYY